MPGRDELDPTNPDPAPRLGEPRWGNRLRHELPPLPARIEALPRHRGYPVPWFVAQGAGEPDFRVADNRKRIRAIYTGLCWVCGGKLGKAPLAFLIGPMCAINRVTAEPACHIECAEWSVVACPFLSRPHMTRREGGMPDGVTPGPGIGLRRNPGVTLLWITKGFDTFRDPAGGLLIKLRTPTKLVAYASGRIATKEELAESVRTGLPLLRGPAEEEGAAACDRLAEMTRRGLKLLGLPQGVAS